MEIELLKLVGLGIPTVFIATVMYVYLLLGIAKIFSGAVKAIISMILYVVFSVLVVFPMFYLISSNQPAIQESTYTLFVVLFGYFAIMAPAMYYLGKVKIKELQRAGYFLSRR